MTNCIKRAVAGAVTLALTAPAAWADSAASTPASGGAASFQGPGWSGYGPGPWMMGSWGGGPMMGYGGYGGWGGGGWMMMLFGGVILVALLVFVFRALAWSAHPPHQNIPHPGYGSAGLQALDERYARGEINREEYQQKKRDILGG